MIRIRFAAATGMNLELEIERFSDGKKFDFSDNTFKTSPTDLGVSIPESGTRPGRYIKDQATSGAQWTDGDYGIYIVDVDDSYATIFAGFTSIKGNDDATVFPLTLAEMTETTLTEDYPPKDAEMNIVQALYGIFQRLTKGSYANNRLYIKDLNGNTAYTIIVDDPTDISTFARED